MKWLSQQFVWVVLLFAVLGYLLPPTMLWVKPAIPWILSVIMLGMGLTLKFEQFAHMFTYWRLVLLGTALQFLIMPFLGWGLSHLLGLSSVLTLGMLVVGSCPGGTASNVVVYLAKGDVPLSISLTTLSTLLAPILTPLLVGFWVGEEFAMPFWPSVWSISKIVLLPILLGLSLNRWLKIGDSKLIDALPVVSMLGIGLIIGCVLALSKDKVSDFPLVVVGAVVLHNCLGLAFGYLSTYFLVKDKSKARTLAIEVGMQNSGLGAHIVNTFFAAKITAALPSAIFSLWHNVSGILLAKFWSKDGRK